MEKKYELLIDNTITHKGIELTKNKILLELGGK